MPGKFSLFIAASAIFTLCQAGCSKGSGSAPVSNALVNKGVITSARNIAVNGFFYNISGAKITIDGLPGNRSDLQAGMVVTVTGIFDNRTSHAVRRTATSVEYDSDFQGAIDCVNILDNSLTIMGQQVLIGTTTNQTVFANFSSTTIIFANASTVSKLNPHLSPQLDTQLYNMVKVSGFSNGINGFQATRIELLAQNIDLTTSFPIMIRSAVDNLDIPGQTFTIGNLTVDYSTMNPVYVPNPFATPPFRNITTVNPIPAPQALTNGTFVKVTGVSSEFEPGNAPTLTPTGQTSISLIKEGPSVKEGDHVAIAGFVSGLSGSAFKVGGIVVNAGAISLERITNSILIEVEGSIKNGVLIASQITPL